MGFDQIATRHRIATAPSAAFRANKMDNHALISAGLVTSTGPSLGGAPIMCPYS